MIVAVLLLLSGCKPKVPSRYIQQGKMRRILYDYCIANEMARREQKDTLLMLTYKAAIMKKHGVTMEQFDSSMVYYTRHTRLLYDIYNKIAEQLEEEAIAQGASLSDISKFGHISSASDTASVWPGEGTLVLSPYLTANSRSFEWKADTSYHKGDKFLIDFDTQYISPEGQRNAVFVMEVKYAGDSVSSVYRNIMSSSHCSMSVVDIHRVGVEEVRCFFLMGQPDTPVRMQLLIINNIKVVKLHTPEPPKKPEEAKAKTDSLRADTVKKATAGPMKPIEEAQQLRNEAPVQTVRTAGDGARVRKMATKRK